MEYFCLPEPPVLSFLQLYCLCLPRYIITTAILGVAELMQVIFMDFVALVIEFIYKG